LKTVCGWIAEAKAGRVRGKVTTTTGAVLRGIKHRQGTGRERRAHFKAKALLAKTERHVLLFGKTGKHRQRGVEKKGDWLHVDMPEGERGMECWEGEPERSLDGLDPILPDSVS